MSETSDPTNHQPDPGPGEPNDDAKGTELLKQFREHKPADVVMAKMLRSLMFIEEAMEEAQGCCGKESQPKDKLAAFAMVAKLQKQHLETVRTIAKFQETTYHAHVKEARKNRSAAPGQQVGMPAVQPNGATRILTGGT